MAHVWFKCYEKRYFDVSKNAQNTTLDTNSNPNPNANPNPDPAPTHINFVRQKTDTFLGGKKLVDHKKSCVKKYYPISVLYPR